MKLMKEVPDTAWIIHKAVGKATTDRECPVEMWKRRCERMIHVKGD
jgi:hypothetical protein